MRTAFQEDYHLHIQAASLGRARSPSSFQFGMEPVPRISAFLLRPAPTMGSQRPSARSLRRGCGMNSRYLGFSGGIETSKHQARAEGLPYSSRPAYGMYQDWVCGWWPATGPREGGVRAPLSRHPRTSPRDHPGCHGMYITMLEAEGWPGHLGNPRSRAMRMRA